MKSNILPKQILYLLIVYATVICLFFLFRLLILPLNSEAFSQILNQNEGLSLILKAFVIIASLVRSKLVSKCMSFPIS